MTQPANYLPRHDVVRVVQDARYAERLMVSEGLPFGYPTVQSSPGDSFECVVTITDILSQGYYTGRIDFLNSAGAVPSWSDGDPWLAGLGNEIKVTTLNAADRLVLGWRYACRIDSIASWNNPFAFPNPDFPVGTLSGEALPIGIVLWTIPLGCGLRYGDDNSVQVDVAGLAGYGLRVNTGGACNTLEVNVAVINSNTNVTAFGCGLDYDAGNATLKVDLTDAVTDPLVWTNCELDLNIGCGLTLSLAGALVVNPVDLAGTAKQTSLVTGPGTCDLAVDLDPSSTTTEWVVEDENDYVAISNGSLCFYQNHTRVEYTNVFNAAGMIIDRFETDRANTNTNSCVNTCLMAECCNAATLTVTSSSNVNSGNSPLDVSFTSNTSGGVGPYTYDWDFGDGGAHATTSTASHTYTTNTNTTFNAVLTVTDSCGRATAATAIEVTVAAGVDAGCACPIPTTLHVAFSGSISTWGTVDFVWTGGTTWNCTGLVGVTACEGVTITGVQLTVEMADTTCLLNMIFQMSDGGSLSLSGDTITCDPFAVGTDGVWGGSLGTCSETLAPTAGATVVG